MALTAKLEFEHYNDNDNLRDVLEMKVYNEEQGIETERKTLEEWRKNDGEEYVGVLNKDEVKTLEVEFSFPTNGDQNDLQNAQIANFNLVFDGVQVTEVMNVTQNTSGNSIQTVLGYNSTDDGDAIIVPSGTYNEDVIVNKDGITLLSASEHGATIKGDTVKVEADNVTIQGFVIETTSNERALIPTDSDGLMVKNNVIISSFRGIQGDVYGRPTNLTIQGNTFDSTHGIAGTEEITGLFVFGNTFNTSVEGIGLGTGAVVIDENGDERDPGVNWLKSNNTFNDAGVVDYR
jgi:hypothetical protein